MIINDLSKRTDRVLDAINEASRALNRTSCTSVNGWGILSDPYMARLSLHEAKQRIEQALTLINQAKWPNSDAERYALEAASLALAARNDGERDAG